ncbi:signal peptidase I [Georgenia alba]|uniref:Signal peptidase I n=1 Tax=Georgenia alba TaxID=2233858 RepID=A0ABW2Q6G5_9MICO
MRALRFLQSTVLNLAAILGTVSVVAVVACLVLGLRPAIVISGSMEPQIPVGGMTFARTIPAADAEVGDVVTLPRPDGSGLVTHRVVGTEPGPGGATLLTLRGDANDTPDPQPYTVRQVGEVQLTVPVLGSVALFMQQNVLLVVGVLVLVGAFASLPLRPTPRRGSDGAGTAAPARRAQPA